MRMNGKLEKVQDGFIAYLGRLCNSFGLNEFVAQLYALLYLNGDRPMSLDEMAQKLHVSKGSVSVNIRILENWGMVSKVWVKGTRKDFYVANPDIKKVVITRVKSGVQKRASEMSEMMEEMKAAVKSADKNWSDEEKRLAKIYQERIREIEGIRDSVLSALNLADKLF